MRKITTLLCSVLAVGCTVMTHAGETALQLSLTDGSSQTYLLQQKPTVRFVDDAVEITTPEASTTYLRSEVSSFTFVDATSTGVGTLVADNLLIRYDGREIAADGCAISVYTTDGRQVVSAIGRVSLDNLNAGLYIATVADRSIKIIKK